MAKLDRKTQKIFAKDAVNNGVFGSRQDGAGVTSTDVETLQGNSAYEDGWLEAVMGGTKLPPLEEMQGLQYAFAYQLAYLFENGIPEYDDGTNYFEYSIVKKTGTYELYGSKTDDNLGNDLTDDTNWGLVGALNGGVEIQDYTEVKSIGETDQQFAGRDYTLAELQARFSTDILAYWNFPDTNIGDDTTGTYDLTGVNVDDTNNTTGIMNDDFGVELNGTDEYLNNGTLLDTVPSAIVYSCWFKADDGQPANLMYLMGKHNNSTAGSPEDFFRVGIETDGRIGISSEENDNGAIAIYSSTRLPNGAIDWLHVVACWDTTYGLRLYVNGLLEAQDASATTLMANGTDSQFMIGARDIEGTIDFYFDGKIANAIVLNKTMTQADVDFLYATTIPLPTQLQGRNFNLRGKYKDSGNDVRTFTPDIVAIEDERILRNGGGFKSDDEIKFMGAL